MHLEKNQRERACDGMATNGTSWGERDRRGETVGVQLRAHADKKHAVCVCVCGKWKLTGECKRECDRERKLGVCVQLRAAHI